MENVDKDLIYEIAKSPLSDIRHLIQSESSDLEATKSLLNLLHNIVCTGSIAVSREKKEYFDSHSRLVYELLSSKRSLSWKKKALQTNPHIALNIAGACPFVELYSSPKSVTKN